jgi:hypothetical protein
VSALGDPPLKDAARLPNPVLILVGASVMMSLAIGMRQCLGLFLPSVTHDLGLTAADYTFGIAAQNVAWGVAQAPVGAIADKLGLRPVRCSLAPCSTSPHPPDGIGTRGLGRRSDLRCLRLLRPRLEGRCAHRHIGIVAGVVQILFGGPARQKGGMRPVLATG